MKTFVRADFDFQSEADQIKHCTGYVICEDVEILENGNSTFKVHSVIVQKLIAKNPNFEKVEELAIKNCKLFEDEIINVGSLGDYHD